MIFSLHVRLWHFEGMILGAMRIDEMTISDVEKDVLE